MKRVRFLPLAICLLAAGRDGMAFAQHRIEASRPAASPHAAYADGTAAKEAREHPAHGMDHYGSRYGIRRGYETCMTRQPEDTSTAGHRQDCADQEFEFQDARLNRAYRDAVAAYEARGDGGKAASTQLRKAQRRWLSRLDRRCAAAAAKAGSTMGPAAQSTCFMDSTAKRADELERAYKDAGN